MKLIASIRKQFILNVEIEIESSKFVRIAWTILIVHIDFVKLEMFVLL